MNTSTPFVKKALDDLHFQAYTPIQEAVLPLLRKGKNAIIQSATGSGKTHSYLIPIFEKLELQNDQCQVVISAPTKELARQIFSFAKHMASFSETTIDCRLYVGGSDRLREVEKLQHSQPQIAIGTPGKLLDFAKQNLLKTHQARTFVIDEADMTLDEGFIPEMDQLAQTFQKQVQMIAVSATMPDQLKHFLKKYIGSLEIIQIENKELTALAIEHWLIKTKEQDKLPYLDKIVQTIQPYLAIIFCNTKETAEQVYQHLSKTVNSITLIHGGLEDRKRKSIIQKIRALEYQWIVATDIISRGIDLNSISHIINYDLPDDVEFYVHRSGRTGRMNQDGICISLYSYDNDIYLDKLESKHLKTKVMAIENGTFVVSKSRNQRSKRVKPGIPKELLHKTVGTLGSTVKPGYKKKYQQAVDKAKKAYGRKKGRNA